MYLLLAQVSTILFIRTKVGIPAGNMGVSFGFLENNSLGALFFLLGALLITSWLIFYYQFVRDALVLLLAGGSSNLIDRLLFGVVRDPIHIGIWVGNIADIMIGIGLVWAITLVLKKNFHNS